MTAQIAIRPLRPDERAGWEPLWKGYLNFYRITAPKETYDATWVRLHDPNEPMWLLGGYIDGKLLGIVHYIYHRSCWTIGDYCYLQDLFVAEGALARTMPAFLFRCPTTGMNVQSWIADDPTQRDDYEAVTCLACRRLHIVSPKTGRVIGKDDKQP